jgi:hypothetical protein
MKESPNYDIVVDNNDKLLGFSLGGAFCAEHEFGGISTMLCMFGVNLKLDNILDIPSDGLGIERRRIKEIPENLVYGELTCMNKKCTVLILMDDYHYRDYKKNYTKLTAKYIKATFNIPFYLLEKKDIATAWDDKSFAIIVSEKYKKYLDDLYDAFNRKDVSYANASI